MVLLFFRHQLSLTNWSLLAPQLGHCFGRQRPSTVSPHCEHFQTAIFKPSLIYRRTPEFRACFIIDQLTRSPR